MERGEVEERGWGECSVNGEDGERLLSKFSSADSFKTMKEVSVNKEEVMVIVRQIASIHRRSSQEPHWQGLIMIYNGKT